MTRNKQLEGIALWRAAEGFEPALKALGLTQREAQYRASESIAAGELPTQILPAVVKTTRAIYDRTEQHLQALATRHTVQGIGVDEEYNVYSFGDQSNIPEDNQGRKFIPGGLPHIMPREKYPQLRLTASGKKVRAEQIGEAFGVDWQTVVNSRGANINLIRDAFEAFGRHASNQEDIDIARLFFNSAGFRTGAGGALNGAVAITGNPDFSDPERFRDAIAGLLEVNIEGVQADYSGYTLLTTTANAAKARQMLATRRLTRVAPRTGTGSTTRSAEWEESLDFGLDIEVLGSKWIKSLYPGIGNGWVLVPKAGADDLPVITSNYLAGYEQPSVWIKDSNARNASGGAVNVQADGDFDSDAIETKVRHVHGASALWTGAIGFSTGTNT